MDAGMPEVMGVGVPIVMGIEVPGVLGMGVLKEDQEAGYPWGWAVGCLGGGGYRGAQEEPGRGGSGRGCWVGMPRMLAGPWGAQELGCGLLGLMGLFQLEETLQLRAESRQGSLRGDSLRGDSLRGTSICSAMVRVAAGQGARLSPTPAPSPGLQLSERVLQLWHASVRVQPPSSGCATLFHGCNLPLRVFKPLPRVLPAPCTCTSPLHMCTPFLGCKRPSRCSNPFLCVQPPLARAQTPLCTCSPIPTCAVLLLGVQSPPTCTHLCTPVY